MTYSDPICAPALLSRDTDDAVADDVAPRGSTRVVEEGRSLKKRKKEMYY